MNTKDYTKGERLYGNITDRELRYMTDEEEKEAERLEREEQLERDLERNDAIFHAMKELDGKL